MAALQTAGHLDQKLVALEQSCDHAHIRSESPQYIPHVPQRDSDNFDSNSYLVTLAHIVRRQDIAEFIAKSPFALYACMMLVNLRASLFRICIREYETCII